MSHVILHMDGDAFFVGVEIAKNPSLRGLPVVTGEERGIVSALSYEAKAMGITRGMPIFKLKKQFPSVIILPGDYLSYVQYSTRMFDVVRRYADVVEEYSIDECFADLTGLDRTLSMTYFEIASRIQSEIQTELGLSVSVGVAPTKVLAKIASTWNKPHGLAEIRTADAHDFLSKITVGKIWGIGRQTALFLTGHGILTAADFIGKSFEWVREHLSKPYQVIWYELCGTSLLHVDSKLKNSYASIQKTRTFHAITNDPTFLLSQLSKHIEEASRKARRYHLVPKVISFFLKTQQFRYHHISIPLETPTHAPEILISVVHMYFKKVHVPDVLYRTAGVGLHELVPEISAQMDLFGGTEMAHKFELIHARIDVLEEKMGKSVVYVATSHRAKKEKQKGTDADEKERSLLFL